MTTCFKGPPLVVHILIATMVNAFFFPLIYDLTGSILYAFLASVAILAAYGLIVLWLVGPHSALKKKGPQQPDEPAENG